MDRIEGRSVFKILTGISIGRDLQEDLNGCEENVGIDLKELWLNTRNWVELFETPYECGIATPGSISLGVVKYY